MSVLSVATLPESFARHLRTARDLAEAHRRTPEEEVFPTTCPGFDRLLDGGLRRGEMVELVGGRSSGRFSLVLKALASATAVGEVAALVDLGDGFDPQAAETAGVHLDRLLWVRPRTTKEALLSAEAILSCGIPLLVLDLGLPPIPGGRGAEAAWLRLQRRAFGHRAALLVASPYRATGTAPRTVLRAREVRPQWHGQHVTTPLLTGLDTRLERVKQRHVSGDVSPEKLVLQHGDVVGRPSVVETTAPEDSTVVDFDRHRRGMTTRRKAVV